ncbi:MAG: putative metal-binding motif-containing protein [Gammaproteobacteria bacterium]
MRICLRLLALSTVLAAPAASAIYQTLPTTPPLRISGFNNVTTDLVSGLKIPDGPIVNGSPGAVVKYGPPSTYTQLATRGNTLVVGGQTVGTLTDYVFRDTADNRLVFGMRLVLAATVNGAPNTFEVNDFFRKGSNGYTAQAAWARASDSDLRMYAAVRTAVKFGQGTETFDPDVVKFQSDINTSEGNPRSGYFFLKSNAPTFKTLSNGVSLYQGGEEGQPLVELVMPGFVPSAQPDGDGDGYDASVDCNDSNPAINPGASEVCDDGIDNNCANGVDEVQYCPVQVPFMDDRALAVLGVVLALLAAASVRRRLR